MQFSDQGADHCHPEPDSLFGHGSAHFQDLPETGYWLFRAVRWGFLRSCRDQLLLPGGDGVVRELHAKYGNHFSPYLQRRYEKLKQQKEMLQPLSLEEYKKAPVPSAEAFREARAKGTAELRAMR